MTAEPFVSISDQDHRRHRPPYADHDQIASSCRLQVGACNLRVVRWLGWRSVAVCPQWLPGTAPLFIGGHHSSQENDNAAETNDREGSQGQAGRQSAEHPGRRVRPGGDSQDPSRRARRPLARAGYRHRALHGPTRGCEAAAARERKGQGEHPQEREIRLHGGSAQTQNPSPSARLARRHRSSEARATKDGFAGGAFAPCCARGGTTYPLGAFGGGTQGSADEGFCSPLCCSEKSSSDPSPRQVAQGG